LDASAGFSLPLTELQAKEFLSESKLNVHIATLDENGHPNIRPTWFSGLLQDTFRLGMTVKFVKSKFKVEALLI
jgi:hypothetical protein